MKRIRGTNEEVKVAIIFFTVSGPVKILLLNRKKFSPLHCSNELMNYIVNNFNNNVNIE